MARVVTVYDASRREFWPVEMGYIRWLKISEALARCGHSVDIATNERTNGGPERFPVTMGEGLRRVQLSEVRWAEYDAVKTLFNTGFQTLEAFGGTHHPFIISKLGSVVDAVDREGIYFYGDYRRELYAIQERINATSSYVTLLSQPARELWETLYGPKTNVLLVPGAADRDVPPAGPDPFPNGEEPRVLFAGNIYFPDAQPEANRILSDKLNQLGRLLRPLGCRLYMIGTGDLSELDPEYVTFLGSVHHQRAWDYFHHAHVGVVLSAGPFMHNNESTKIYHYLRAGLPVVSEAGFPNDYVVRTSGLGFVVESGDIEGLAWRVEEAAHTVWDRDAAARFILENHTWDRRVEAYDRLLRSHFP